MKVLIIFCFIAFTSVSSFGFEEAPKASRKETIATGYLDINMTSTWKSYRSILESAGHQIGEISGVIIDQQNGYMEKIDFVHSNKNFKVCPWSAQMASFAKTQSVVNELKAKQKSILDIKINSEFGDGKINTIQIFYCK